METVLDLSALLLFVCLLEKFEWEFAARLGPRLCGAKNKKIWFDNKFIKIKKPSTISPVICQVQALKRKVSTNVKPAAAF